MTDKTVETAIDEIFDFLNEYREDVSTDEVEEVIAKAERPELRTTEWTPRPCDESKRERMVLFSELFWEPTTMPDHLVPVFEGYDVPGIPDIYIPPKPEFEQMSLGFSLGLRLNTVGPTGAGKTLMYEYFANKTGRPYLRIEHNVELDKASVFGQTHLNTNEDGKQDTDFIPGVFVLSSSAPTLVNLDELSRASGFANMIYQRPLDRNEIFLPEMKDSGKQAITPDPFWIICASDNTKGNGDDMDLYSASNVQDAAFTNRWDMVIELNYLDVEQEQEMFMQMAPNVTKGVAKKLAKFSKLIHTGFNKGEIQTAFSPRNLLAIAKLFESGVDMETAIRINYINRLAKSEVPDVQECLRSVFG